MPIEKMTTTDRFLNLAKSAVTAVAGASLTAAGAFGLLKTAQAGYAFFQGGCIPNPLNKPDQWMTLNNNWTTSILPLDYSNINNINAFQDNNQFNGVKNTWGCPSGDYYLMKTLTSMVSSDKNPSLDNIMPTVLLILGTGLAIYAANECLTKGLELLNRAFVYLDSDSS